MKRRTLLRRIVPDEPSLLLYAHHAEARNVVLFASVCDMGVEAILAKWEAGPYLDDGERTTGVKIENPHCTRGKGRRELRSVLRELRLRFGPVLSMMARRERSVLPGSLATSHVERNAVRAGMLRRQPRCALRAFTGFVVKDSGPDRSPLRR
jgi:hypothetical protein